ncbi:MAG TPA: hypothetical protein VKN62_07885 [Pelovirga sp.]|nr:hypothetical protein [Pelovirga sp.]
MIFAQLQEVMEVAQNEQDLPDYLAEQIQFIIDHQQQYKARQAQIEKLIEQVSLYDTYGQTGYLGMGVSNLILEKTLQRLIDS